jgi:hypothetical protein
LLRTRPPFLLTLLAGALLGQARGGSASPDAGSAAAPPDAEVLPPAAGAEAATGEARTVDYNGLLTSGRGRPVSQALVFAIRRGSPRIVAAVRPDVDGLFQMKLPPGAHDFGIISSRWLLGGLQSKGRTTLTLTVNPAFPETEPAEVVRAAKAWVRMGALPGDAAARAQSWSGSAIAQVTGVVVDETGVPLEGVRLLTTQEDGERLLSVTQTDRRGRYTLVTLAGPTRVYAHAPGLTLKQGRVKGYNQLDITLAIDAEVETIVFRSGRRLSFRMEDSVYPEMLPPPPVAAAISFDYGILLSEGCFCPGDLLHQPPPTHEERRNACLWSRRQNACSDASCPSSTWARSCMIPKHWWLRMIQTSPPNPNQLRDAVTDQPTMWWYDAIKAMQEEDARVAAPKR